MAKGGSKEIGTAYIKVKPNVDGFESEMKGAGQSGGASFGGTFAMAAGSLIAKGVEMAVGAAVDLAKNVIGGAFENSGAYEQLAGGAQKIFDEMDFSKISEDAQRAYKELNMSANEYLESINLAGATFAQTMGDEKGYDTARRGMMAISDYASGTGKNIDELNQKYQMITRAASSYQSIADQFAGILPATSADFLEQAKAAGLLGEQYSKLTDVPVAEYQQAVTAMLEKGVADLGLTNNTASESMNTLTGSIAMAQSAWQNWLTELGKDEADMPARTNELVEAISAAARNIVPRIIQIGGELIANVPTLIGQIVGAVKEALLPQLDEMTGGAASGIWNAFEEMGKHLVDMFGKIMEHLGPLIEKLGPVLTDVILPALGVAFDVLGEAIGVACDIIGGLLDILNAIIQAAKDAAKAVGDFFTNSNGVNGQGLPSSVPSAKPFASGGIVTGPTLGLIGEAGYDEAVIPLTKSGIEPFISALGGAGVGGPTVHVHVTSRTDDPYALGSLVGDRAAYQMKLRGVSA